MGRAKAATTPTDTPAPLDPSPLLDPSAAAQFLGVSPRTLANWRTREMGPPFVRISLRCIMYRPIDLQTWAQAARSIPVGVDDVRRVQKRYASAQDAQATPDTNEDAHE